LLPFFSVFLLSFLKGKVKVHKLDIDEFNEVDYDLIAINTAVEDYRLAFFLNESLNLSLSRLKEDIVLHDEEGKEVGFSVYGYEDEQQHLYWSLVQNQQWTENRKDESSLFEDFRKKLFLLSELKNVNFFLKIQGSHFDSDEIQDILTKIKKIEKVSAAFWIDAERIRAKNNLIF